MGLNFYSGPFLFPPLNSTPSLLMRLKRTNRFHFGYIHVFRDLFLQVPRGCGEQSGFFADGETARFLHFFLLSFITCHLLSIILFLERQNFWKNSTSKLIGRHQPGPLVHDPTNECTLKQLRMATTEINKNFSKDISKKIEHLWTMVGNTPMLEILYEYKGRTRAVYAKCEHYNLTGSIKDRMALYILQKAYEKGLIRPGNHIVEATSGNTGISFAAVGRALGHAVTIVMPDWLSKERAEIIRSLGAEVILVSKQQDGFKGCIKISEELALADSNIFLPQQFENQYNLEANQKTTGREIWAQMKSLGYVPEVFVAGVGTGGTVMGMNRYLKKKHPYVQVHPIEPMESPTLSTGHKIGSHRIQGISDEFIPPIVDLATLDDVIQVSDGDAILMAQKLSKQLGLAVGISSGANIAGAIMVQNYRGDKTRVVTVFPDSKKKYLSTDLMKE
jgi:cysteine synthase